MPDRSNVTEAGSEAAVQNTLGQTGPELNPDTRSEGEVRAQAIVDQWQSENLHNSDFSRDTPAWNHYQANKQALVALIAAALEG